MPLTRALRVLAASFLALSLLAAPSDVRAGNVPTTTNATYELLPDQGLMRVTVAMTVKNLIPSVTQGNVTTNYFLDEASFAAHEDGTNFRATTPGGSASVTIQRKAGYLPTATVHFPSTFYGATRALTITYDVKGSPPRSDNPTRIGNAFASFCTFPAGVYTGDPESFSVIIPSRFEITQTDGPTLASQTVSYSRTLLTNGQSTTPKGSEFNGACFVVNNPQAYASTDTTTDSGITVTTEAWPEDHQWSDAVSAAAGTDLAALEEAIGVGPDTDEITIREVLAEALSGYAGTFDPERSVAQVSEDALEPLVAAHELAHAWFNDAFSDEVWISEGYAEYYGRHILGASQVPPCPEPDAATQDLVELGDWTFLPAIWTEEDQARIAAQYGAACWVVTEVAGRIGDDAMREVVQAATEWEIPYVGVEPAEVFDPGPATWQRWMDLVDERGLIPAEAEDPEWLQALLVDLGAATGAEVDHRAETRALYHDLLADSAPWDAPMAIRREMTNWQFETATDYIAVGVGIDALHDEAVELVPDVADSTVIEDAYELADDESDLTAATAMAEEEREAADVVADAAAAAESDPNPVEAVGLLGSDLDASAAAATESLVNGDYEAATATANETIDAKANAALGGALRIGGALLVAAAVGGGIIFWRRRKGTPALVAAGDEDDSVESAEEAGEAARAVKAESTGEAEKAGEEGSTEGDLAPALDDDAGETGSSDADDD